VSQQEQLMLLGYVGPDKNRKAIAKTKDMILSADSFVRGTEVSTETVQALEAISNILNIPLSQIAYLSANQKAVSQVCQSSPSCLAFALLKQAAQRPTFLLNLWPLDPL
jgi:hypothetical protein